MQYFLVTIGDAEPVTTAQLALRIGGEVTVQRVHDKSVVGLAEIATVGMAATIVHEPATSTSDDDKQEQQG